MKVFVLSKEGKPLMPTTPRRARLWLREKRARVVRPEPFTIRLRFATKLHVQKAVVGVDTGSKEVGIAATTNSEVVFQAEVHLRDDISNKMTQRRMYRRNRRGRKTRYRKPRGLNQRFNGQRSEHKCWAPRKVRGFKLYELVKAKGQVGYIAGRREKGAFVIKDVTSGKKLLEVTPRQLVRVARSTQGWMITRQLVLDHIRKEGGVSSHS